MLPAQVRENLQLQVVGYHAGNVHLSLVVPFELLPSIQSFFTSSYDLVKFISLKSKHSKSLARVHDLEQIRLREESISERNNTVMLLYEGYTKSGLNHNQAIKETSKHFDYLNCYQIGLILKESIPKKSRKRGNQ